MSKNFLGTNFGHDSAVAVVDQDGCLEFAIEESKIIGQKDCSLFPDASLKLALDRLSGAEIAWFEGWNWHRRLLHKGFGATLRFGAQDKSYVQYRCPREWARYIEGFRAWRRWRAELGIPRFVGHHLSHCLSLVPWGLQNNSLVLISDTTGEIESLSSFHWANGSARLVARSYYPNSLGAVYHQAAYHLGYPGSQGPGKLMALAGYGQPSWASELNLVARSIGGRVLVDERFPVWRRDGAWRAYAEMHRGTPFGHFIRNAHLARDLQQGADFAASVQSWFSNTTLTVIGQGISIAGGLGLKVSHVALAGGSAMNCQTNGGIQENLGSLGVQSLLVSPWSNDAGTAIGAAVAGALGAGVRDFSCVTPLLGPRIDGVALGVSRLEIESAVSALAAQQIICLVSGGVEFGPRALGGRCILANARDHEVRAKLNLIKGRPHFMPFAPITLEDTFTTYFTGLPSTSMTWTVGMRPGVAESFPGMFHPTSQARAQLVTKRSASLLHEVLRRFAERTGDAILLLTSLNGSGEAVSSSAASAIVTGRQLGLFGCLSDAGWIEFGNDSDTADVPEC